jgi:hypothetical protein
MSNKRTKLNCNVNSIEHLKDMYNPMEAKELLERVSKTVNASMTRRNYVVRTLKEFYPKEKGLLGMNVNRKNILIRLRPHHNPKEFFSWGHILGTMIHELTHMTIGPHSAKFYELMDEIHNEGIYLSNYLPMYISKYYLIFHNEVDKDIDSGIINMSGSFQTLGSGSSGVCGINISKEKSKQLAVDAALKRQNISSLSSGSGQKLGGGDGKKLSLKEIRNKSAEAAERRLQDDVWCHPCEITKTTKQKANFDDWTCHMCDEINPNTNSCCSLCTIDRYKLCGECIPVISSNSSNNNSSKINSNNNNNNNNSHNDIIINPFISNNSSSINNNSNSSNSNSNSSNNKKSPNKKENKIINNNYEVIDIINPEIKNVSKRLKSHPSSSNEIIDLT